MKRFRLALFCLSCVLLVCCATSQFPGGAPGSQSPDPALTQKISAACFEVVTEKPTKDSLSYEKALDWNLVDFAIRNDKYIPLGTAFAIGPDELVTAAHVLSLTSNSMVANTRFIREKAVESGKAVERVYEIDDIRAFDNSRDYVVFTVKGRKFDTWLTRAPAGVPNARVYTAGDAFGEGIVIRSGTLLDTVPEPEQGAWKFLKSSIATNPGSSGGPLLDAHGDVMGVVQARRDDFCYSLPMSEITAGKGTIHSRVNFYFSVFRKRKSSTLDATLALPMKYKNLIQTYHDRYMPFYTESMDGLLSENKEDLFPEGVHSEQALFDSVAWRFPQIFLQDTTSGMWFQTELSPSRSEIGHNGAVSQSEIYKDAGVWLVKLDAPDGVSVNTLVGDPRLSMDLVLRGIDYTRKLADSDPGTRITSFGPPIHTLTHVDRFKRAWQINTYLLEFEDQIVITCSTPTPQGLCLIWVQAGSDQEYQWLYDIRKIVDFVNVSYCGTLAQWTAFLQNPDVRVAAMKDVSISFKERSTLEIDTDAFSARIPNGLIEITNDTFVGLWCGVFLRAGLPVFDIRDIELHSRDSDGTFYVFYRWSRPGKSLGKDSVDQWQTLQNGDHPFSGKAFSDKGSTCVGLLEPSFTAAGKPAIKGDFAYTIFVSKEGTASQQEMTGYLQDFADGTRIKER